MKLIVDIDEKIYKESKKECKENDSLIIDTFTYAIGNGIPLEEELEKIKQEIQGLIDFEQSCCGNTTLGYECLGVIEDKISELKGDKKMNKELKTVKIGMESDFIIVNKDFIIKEFEKIKSEMIQERDSVDLSCADSFNWNIRLIDKHIAELKGETK